jgi:hypothetical protein
MSRVSSIFLMWVAMTLAILLQGGTAIAELHQADIETSSSLAMLDSWERCAVRASAYVLLAQDFESEGNPTIYFSSRLQGIAEGFIGPCLAAKRSDSEYPRLTSITVQSEQLVYGDKYTKKVDVCFAFGPGNFRCYVVEVVGNGKRCSLKSLSLGRVS